MLVIVFALCVVDIGALRAGVGAAELDKSSLSLRLHGALKNISRFGLERAGSDLIGSVREMSDQGAEGLQCLDEVTTLLKKEYDTEFGNQLAAYNSLVKQWQDENSKGIEEADESEAAFQKVLAATLKQLQELLPYAPAQGSGSTSFTLQECITEVEACPAIQTPIDAEPRKLTQNTYPFSFATSEQDGTTPLLASAFHMDPWSDTPLTMPSRGLSANDMTSAIFGSPVAETQYPLLGSWISPAVHYEDELWKVLNALVTCNNKLLEFKETIETSVNYMDCLSCQMKTSITELESLKAQFAKSTKKKNEAVDEINRKMIQLLQETNNGICIMIQTSTILQKFMNGNLEVAQILTSLPAALAQCGAKFGSPKASVWCSQSANAAECKTFSSYAGFDTKELDGVIDGHITTVTPWPLTAVGFTVDPKDDCSSGMLGSPGEAVAPPHRGQYIRDTRGYSFVAPVDFAITKISVPTDVSKEPMNFVVFRLGPGCQAMYPSCFSKSCMEELASGISINALEYMLPTPIEVKAGENIGILADRGRGANSYTAGGSLEKIIIDGIDTPIKRFLVQSPVVDSRWQSSCVANSKGSKGRFDFSYSTGKLR